MKKTTTYFFSKNKRKSFHFSVLSLPWCSGRFFVSSLLEIPPPPSLLPSSQWSPPSPSRVSSSEGGKSGWRGVRGGRGDATKRKKRRSSPSPSSVFLARVYLRKEKKKTRRRRRGKAHSQKVGIAATALLCAKNSKKFIPPPPPLFERVGEESKVIPPPPPPLPFPLHISFCLSLSLPLPISPERKIPPTYARKERDKGDLLASPKKKSREATPGDS